MENKNPQLLKVWVMVYPAGFVPATQGLEGPQRRRCPVILLLPGPISFGRFPLFPLAYARKSRIRPPTYSLSAKCLRSLKRILVQINVGPLCAIPSDAFAMILVINTSESSVTTPAFSLKEWSPMPLELTAVFRLRTLVVTAHGDGRPGRQKTSPAIPCEMRVLNLWCARRDSNPCFRLRRPA